MQRSIVFKSRAMQVIEAREGRDLGELLRELYVEQGMTQAAIAARIGTRRETISRWMGDLGIESRWGPRAA